MRGALGQPAGRLRRLSAFGWDQLIVGSLWLLLSVWTVVAYLSLSRWPGDLGSLAALYALLCLLGITLHAAYWIVFIATCGQTPGKMLRGLEVVVPEGRPVGYGRAFRRWLGMGLSALPFGLGFLGVFLTRERRGLHDWLAGTRVVRRPPVGSAGKAAVWPGGIAGGAAPREGWALP